MWLATLNLQVPLVMLFFSCIGKLVLAIINSSLSYGVVPVSFKHALVQPLLKKPGLDHTVLANFSPGS